MVMVCVATWQFGVLGATGAAVAGSFALHGIRFLLARRFGCPYGLEPGLLWGLGIVLGVYLLTYWVGVPFTAKLLLTGVVVATVLVKAAPFCSNGRWATLWPTSK